METKVTIRNCPTTFRFECPKNWEDLVLTTLAEVRHCAACRRDVHYCKTDEETIEHAKAGHCIAREIPDESELPLVVVGMPKEPVVSTPQQEEAGKWFRRERDIDDSIKNADSDRSCPRCNFPAPPWRGTCRVCGLEMGRTMLD